MPRTKLVHALIFSMQTDMKGSTLILKNFKSVLWEDWSHLKKTLLCYFYFLHDNVVMVEVDATLNR